MSKGPSALEVMERFATVGPDFLTWMCVHSQRDDLPAPASEPGLAVRFLGPMVVAGDGGEATKATLAGDEAPASPELRTALAAGKRIMRSKIEFIAQDATWTFTLDGETFDMRSVKLPVPKVADLDEHMSLRVQALQQAAFLVDQLFDLFLPLRADAQGWAEEVKGWKHKDKV
jgi:hypothetical protein